jgi:hypothetical protein
MQEFLVCYDYGTGGLWAYVWASSVESIRVRFPELTVYESEPPFWNQAMEAYTKGYPSLDDLAVRWAGISGGTELP